jgi:hypothetical protein
MCVRNNDTVTTVNLAGSSADAGTEGSGQDEGVIVLE